MPNTERKCHLCTGVFSNFEPTLRGSRKNSAACLASNCCQHAAIRPLTHHSTQHWHSMQHSRKNAVKPAADTLAGPCTYVLSRGTHIPKRHPGLAAKEPTASLPPVHKLSASLVWLVR